MATFKNIPHIERIIFKRTFMNEIALFFTYNLITDFENVCERIKSLLPSNHSDITKENDKLIYKDSEAIITFTPNGVLISIPSKQYKDFEETGPIWDNLESILKEIGINPQIWSFTKGNRFLFNIPIQEETYSNVFQLVLSENLINYSSKDHVYVEESQDHTCVFTSRYSIDRFEDKDSLSLKTMIVSQSYHLSKLKEQIMMKNEDMFDCWHWCMSQNVLELMKRETL